MSSKKKKGKSAPKRQERRFVAQSGQSGLLVRVLGGVGAALLGAGTWAYFYAQSFESEKLKPIPSYVIAAGAIVMGIALWLGTTSEPTLRVGDPGIGVEKGELRRMPWWSIAKIAWDSGARALQIVGKDEAGADFSFRVPVTTHADAAGWILREAHARIPKIVEVDDAILESLPGASSTHGTRVELEPLQVVGRKCAVTGKTISYEPDGQVCPRCERVYSKANVPHRCKCGNELRARTDGDPEDEPDDEREPAEESAET